MAPCGGRTRAIGRHCGSRRQGIRLRSGGTAGRRGSVPYLFAQVSFGTAMLILTKSTLRNPSILQTRTLPRKFFRRVMVLPRGATVGQWLRIVVENQFLRYMVTLLPFVGVVLVWEDAGLAVAHAPSDSCRDRGGWMRVLRLSEGARSLITPDEAAQIGFAGLSGQAIRSVAAQQGLRKCLQ